MHDIRRVTALTYFQAYALTQRKNYRAGPQRRRPAGNHIRRQENMQSRRHQARMNTRSAASWLCLDTDVRRRLRTQSYLRDVKIA